ncbi:cupin domain-containing protein [Streptomyces sp. NPDC001930]|uniref:AraC family transcriptional regulator n=1 Tax=Streptomyces sp. NPDC001930 TaxID=3364625 RepID=UPI0036BC97A5
MDVLADVLATTGFTGALLAQLHSNGSQWGCDLDKGGIAGFHLIADGACWLQTENMAPIQLVSGDVVLLPRGTPHQLLGSPGAETRPYSDIEAENPPGRTGVVDMGGDGPPVRVVCGKFQYATSTDRHPVLSALPEVVHVPGMAADPQLQSVVRFLAAEATNSLPGSRAVATRLTEVLFILTVRNWLERVGDADSGPSWLTALRDPDIGAALSLMHEQPQEDWTVESLARTVAMSRPTFARRFKSTVGASPLAYLSRVRLEQAARQLRDTNDALGIIARNVGYASEYAFSRAFTRELGVPPSRYRRTANVDA